MSKRDDAGDARRREIRCAIYTRKSTEEGLDQEFNSLAAQREACAAYITSQRHEGWTLHPELYDDGGFSGGNMDRPGLGQLLKDIREGRVDVIVVYKVDRLTRSLADFAKIVDIMDEAGASFVSVTQSFNTTTSMGRLTLNVLLSFAQFEREVTGERIRDKIAASKKKGIWMGGTVPFGYVAHDRKLHIAQDEAPKVRRIFDRYLELGSVPLLAHEIAAAGVRSRKRVSRHGREYGGAILSRGALYAMLQNRIYVGDVVHKGHAFAGEHDAIIELSLFETVQAQLERNRVIRRNGEAAAAPSLFAGLIEDGQGRPMSPNQARKGKRRYRYYASRDDRPVKERQPSWRVPAADLEEIVVAKLRAIFSGHKQLTDLVPAGASPDDHQQLHVICDEWQDKLSAAQHCERRNAVLQLIRRVVVHETSIEIAIIADRIAPGLIEEVSSGDMIVSLEAKIVRTGKRTCITIPATEAIAPIRRDTSLITLIAKAVAARKSIEASADDPKQIAATAGFNKDYFARLVRIGYLAPDIITAILEGRQPPTLTRKRLARTSNIPIDWNEQRQLLGFEPA